MIKIAVQRTRPILMAMAGFASALVLAQGTLDGGSARDGNADFQSALRTRTNRQAVNLDAPSFNHKLPLLSSAQSRVQLGAPVGHPELGRMLLDERFQTQKRVPVVEGFTAYGGDWRVQEGMLQVAGGPGPKLLLNGTALAAGEVGVEMLLPDRRGGNAGLLVKVSQPGVGADAFNGYEIALDAGAQILRLGRHRQNFELIRDTRCEVPVNEWIPVAVRLTEDTLEVRVNGRNIISYRDDQHPLKEGAIGLRPWQQEARYRNLYCIQNDGGRRDIPFAPARSDREHGVVSGWKALQVGAPQAEFSIDTGGPYGGRQHQRMTRTGGSGEAGLVHDQTLFLVAGQAYEGFVCARADQPVDISVAILDAEGKALAEAPLNVKPGDWQVLGFTLTPQKSEASGRLAVKLKSDGAIRLGRVLLEPADWAWPSSLATGELPPVVFLRRPMLSGPPVVGCDLWAARPTAPGCAIGLLDPGHPGNAPRTVFADPEGSIYDLNLSLDARTIFFSYARKGEKHWHLWRIGTDGQGLRQITDGPYYDVGPCELPDGDLVFVSTRRFGHTVCQPGPASNLYRVSAEGGEPQCLSMNTLSDTTPQLLPDGRVLFMRWEYVDRDLTYRQSLWTQNPDGTGYQLFFGNTIRDPGTFWQARPIPGRSDRVLATFAPHHGYPHGAIGWIERRHGPEAGRGIGFDWITKEFPTIGDHAFVWSYRDPFPLDDESFLCSYGGEGVERFRILLHDQHDRRRLLYEDPAMHCFFPIALRATPQPPMLSARAPATQMEQPDLPEEHAADAQPMGICVLADVYQGLEPAIERGRVKYLRIMEQVRKTEDIPVTPHVVEFGPRAYDQSPLMSYGTYYAKRCWGWVPVEADGSAHFQAPALREIYFQVCDAEGRELQRMTSAAQLMPRETIGCVGCHEHRNSAPPVVGYLRAGPRAGQGTMPLAARRAPSVPRKPAWAPDGIIDFVEVVQPVLDRHCARCHSGGDPAGGCDLSGDKTRFFNMAYDNLLGRSQSYRQHNLDTGEMLPAEAAKGKPLVHFYWLLRTPTAVNQPLWTGTHASRLQDFLTAEHCEKEIPPEDRLRIYTWIDADVPYYGTYATSRPKCGGKRDLCATPDNGAPARWFAEGFLPVYQRRCAECHGEFPSTHLVTCWDGKTAWINFTRPELSPALTAHLPKAAGGRGLEKSKEGKPVSAFASPQDPDYQTMLNAIRMGKNLAEQTPGPDMAGYAGRTKEP